MKVMCIKQGDWSYDVSNEIATGPQYGESVTVIREIDGYYILAEYAPDMSYAKEWFIPLSNIDEMELVNERQLQEA